MVILIFDLDLKFNVKAISRDDQSKYFKPSQLKLFSDATDGIIYIYSSGEIRQYMPLTIETEMFRSLLSYCFSTIAMISQLQL